MASDGQVVFEISADNRDALRAIDQTTDALEDAGREWESNARDAGENMTQAFTKALDINRIKDYALKAGKALLDFGMDAIQVASDLEEVQNVVDTTFGAGASRINEWAKTASTSFGLTELQAKQFTSTLGAMMKSSGLAGDQIIDMSTDLAGLAADMASFYNLDFETAFQKIRSGISGETEPLKQLGINMSVVNLEAFALTQGITKAFSEMSQGEQTMLRYQYIMQATSDAQGDFARTSDGYANSLRKLESQVDNLKAKMGKPLLDVISGATGFLNDFIDTIVGEEKPKTLLDKVADIDIQKELKIADIQAVASEAEGLLLSLEEISGKLGASGDITGYFSDVSASISAFDDVLLTNNIEQNLGDLAGNLNPTVANDGEFAESLDELESSIDGIDTTIGETKNGINAGMSVIAGAIKANATDGDGMKTSLEAVATGIGTLSDKTEAAETAATAIGDLADGLNPTITNDGEFATSLDELKGSVDGLEQQLSGDVGSIKQGLGDLSGALPKDGTAGDNAKKALEAVAGGVTALSGAVATADTNDTSGDLKNIVDNLPDDADAGADVNAALTDAAAGVSALSDAVGGASGVDSGLTGLKEAVEINPDESGLTGSFDSVSESVKDLNIRVSNAKTNDVKGKLEDLASGLSANLGGDAKKWTNLLQAISGNAAQAIAATSGDTGATATFLESVAAGANDLTTDYSEYWGNLLGALGDNAGDAISALATEGDPGAVLTAIAGGANSLASGTADEWSDFVSAIDGIKISDAKGLQGVANALATNVGGDAEKWSNLLSAIKDNAGGALAAIGDNDGSTTKAFLENVAAGADDYTTDYSTYWSNLLGVLGDNAGEAISALDGGSTAGAAIGSIAEGANELEPATSTAWRSFLNIFKNFKSSVGNALDNPDAGAGIRSIANALVNAPAEEKAAAWKTFLDALGSNTGVLTSLTGKSAEESAQWLQTIADGVKQAELSPEDANTWSTLLGAFVEGMPNLRNTQEGEQFYQQLINDFLALGKGSQVAEAGLAALGYETDDITTMQDRWLTICRQLVKTLPELSAIINTETGEVKGGTAAVQEYIDAWKADQILRTRIDALKQQKELLENEMSIDWGTKVDVQEAMAYAELLKSGRSEYEAKRIINDARKQRRIYKPYVNESEWNVTSTNRTSEEARKRGAGEYQIWKVSEQEAQALKNLLSLEDQRDQAIKNNAYVIDYLNEKIAAMTEETGKSEDELFGMSEAAEEAAENFTTLEKAARGDTAAMTEVQSAIESATNAFRELADYQERVLNETEQSIKSTITGFEKIETAGQKAYKTFEDITQGENESAEAYNKRFTEAQNAMPSLQKMTQGLQSQLEFMQQYKALMEQARAKGVSEDILATLSDGSQESFDYLYALVNTEGSIEALNQAYADVQSEAETFTDALTQQKLAVDETYKSLVEAAQEAAAGLNVSGEAYISITETVEAIAAGLAGNKDKVQKQVDEILAQIARLSGSFNYGAGPTWGAGISFSRIWAGKAADVDGTSANGLDNVPFDGYLALLHQGERIQTAAEADLARRYSYQQPAFDYGALGGAIGASISTGGGNVYLDGQTVGRIISDRQANSYRALERSGWQG